MSQAVESLKADLLLRHYSRAASVWGRLGWWVHFQEQRLRAQGLAHGGEWAKRGFDILVSAWSLLVLAPALGLIGLLVKLEDGGPVFFAQTRVGRYGREFRMYKIRSMCLDAERRFGEVAALNHHREGVTFKLKADPRITRVGRWLRKYSLDELPQLVNVLLGDMSLVGPRPPVPREVLLYSLADRRRLAIKPGITCLWQIGGRSEIDFSGQVRLDVFYIEHQSFGLDLRILWRTIPAVLSGRGAC